MPHEDPSFTPLRTGESPALLQHCNCGTHPLLLSLTVQLIASPASVENSSASTHLHILLQVSLEHQLQSSVTFLCPLSQWCCSISATLPVSPSKVTLTSFCGLISVTDERYPFPPDDSPRLAISFGIDRWRAIKAKLDLRLLRAQSGSQVVPIKHLYCLIQEEDSFKAFITSPPQPVLADVLSVTLAFQGKMDFSAFLAPFQPAAAPAYPKLQTLTLVSTFAGPVSFQECVLSTLLGVTPSIWDQFSPFTCLTFITNCKAINEVRPWHAALASPQTSHAEPPRQEELRSLLAHIPQSVQQLSVYTRHPSQLLFTWVEDYFSVVGTAAPSELQAVQHNGACSTNWGWLKVKEAGIENGVDLAKLHDQISVDLED